MKEAVWMLMNHYLILEKGALHLIHLPQGNEASLDPYNMMQIVRLAIRFSVTGL